MVGPTAVWSLDHTASSTLSIAKEVIRAATTDNVQPLALVACEKFGATLAMCPETNKKIEDLIIKVSGPKLVKFMSAQIGYSFNDCATQLSQSLAGVQFLGLAAALVSSVSMFEGANALSDLVMASASDKTLVPTVRQLKDLLGALEHRVNRSGFTDIWVGYQDLLIGSLCAFHAQGHLPSGKFHRETTNFMAYPATEGISKLVEAFRELDRLGNVIAITIHASSCAPWVMAFTRWCLGMPPSTYLPNGKALLDQVDSRITLFTSQNLSSSAFEISIQRSVGSPAELVKFQLSSRRPFGMISLECFGRMWCQIVGGEGSETYRAVSEALPYALKQVYRLFGPVESLVGSTALPATDDSYLEEHAKLASKYPVEIRAQPFPRESTISNILTRVLNLKSQQNLMSLSEGNLISDLPLLSVCLRSLAETCTCDPCQSLHQTPTNASEDSIEIVYCKRDALLTDISSYAADILALSLFENPGTLLVLLDRHDTPASLAYARAVYAIITSGMPTVCGSRSVIDWALRLVGHESTRYDPDGERERDWIISCSKGQAVYPKVFETQSICQPGYLVLYWAPGLLFFNGEKYDRGIGASVIYGEDQVSDVDEALQSRSVIGPLNIKPNMKTEWKVTCCEGYLEILLVCGKSFRNPFNILLNLESSLILRGCPHDSASPLERPDRFASYWSLIDPSVYSGLLSYEPDLSSETDRERNVRVVAVDGDAGLRMFAISSETPKTASTKFVVRDNSCLQCCLNLCRRAESTVLVC